MEAIGNTFSPAEAARSIRARAARALWLQMSGFTFPHLAA